jgi:hypothetical protein
MRHIVTVRERQCVDGRWKFVITGRYVEDTQRKAVDRAFEKLTTANVAVTIMRYREPIPAAEVSLATVE